MNIMEILKQKFQTEKRSRSAKGQLGIPILVGAVLATITLAVALVVLASLQFDPTIVNSTAAQTAINNSLTLSTNATAQFPLVGTMIGLGIVLAVVAVFFIVGNKRTGDLGL